MKYTVEDMMKMMAAGQTPEQIAQDFTDKLNAAINQEKEAKEAALKASKVKEDRIFALEQIVDDIADFVKKFYPDMYEEKMFADFDAKDLDKAIAEAYDEVKRMAPMLDALKDLVDPTLNPTDKAINDFLKRYGLN